VRDGSPLAAGESGDVLVTDLHNYGFPLIRYANGDVATMKAEAAPCRCGRGLRRLRSVEGRRADTLVDKQGQPIPGIVFHVLLADAKSEIVSQFQAIQRTDGSVTLKIVRGKKWTAEGFAVLEGRVRDYLRGQPMQVEWCHQIPLMPNGKRKTIIVEKR
jgi:phenylacetate-CoA ligase